MLQNKKAFLALGFSLALCSVLQAESGFVVGAIGGVSNLSTSSDAFDQGGRELELHEIEKDLKTFSYGFKVGYDLYFHPNQAVRFYADYVTSRYDGRDIPTGDPRMDTYAFNVDYRYDILPNLGLFAGPNLHYTQLKTNTSYPAGTTIPPYGNESKMGIGFGGGVVFAPLPFLEIEGRLRYLNVDFPDKFVPLSSTDQTNGVAKRKFNIDDPFSVFFGINFKF